MPLVSEVHVNKVLTNILLRRSVDGLVADVLFPRINVNEISGVYYKFGTEMFRIHDQALRGPGAAPARIEFAMSTDTYSCNEYSLEHAVDDRVLKNADRPLQPLVDAAEILQDNLRLAREKRVADLCDTTNITNNATPGVTSGYGAKWDAATGVTIISDCRKAVDNVRKQIGTPANLCVVPADVWSVVVVDSGVLDAIKYTNLGVVTEDLFARLIGVDSVVVARARYLTSAEGQSDTFGDIWGDKVVVAYVARRPGIKVASFGYTFAHQNETARQYRDERAKSTVVEVSHIVDEKIVMAEAAFLLNDVLA